MGSIQPAALQGARSAAETFCWEMDPCFSSGTWYSFHCWGKHVLGRFRAEQKARLSPPEQEQKCARVCFMSGRDFPLKWLCTNVQMS